MVRKRHASCVALALSLAACGDQTPNVDSGVDAASAHDAFDAASCDPLAFQQPLEASAANITAALDPHCFNTGDARHVLVIDALCTHDMTCAVTHAKDCRDEYEAGWQERLHPHGLSVPCMDALLDAMSCRAQASCGDTHACDEATVHADQECDPNTPRGPMCPPLPEGRELTKGPIPDDAINDAGMLDESRIPDFIPALNRDGEIAGYVRHCAIAAGGAVPVYADDLTTVVGHMIPNRGFVPGDVPP